MSNCIGDSQNNGHLSIIFDNALSYILFADCLTLIRSKKNYTKTIHNLFGNFVIRYISSAQETELFTTTLTMWCIRYCM